MSFTKLMRFFPYGNIESPNWYNFFPTATKKPISPAVIARPIIDRPMLIIKSTPFQNVRFDCGRLFAIGVLFCDLIPFPGTVFLHRAFFRGYPDL